jgi:hypothetical protein
MARVARYLIAQHVADLFRNEPRNVGVVVQIGADRTSRFIGESLSGRIDGRSIKHMPYPDVYRQWVEYWNSALAGAGDPIVEILETSGKHYRIVDGGEVADIGDDSVHEVAGFLFASLVDEAGFAKALGGEEADIVTVQLQEDVLARLAELSILSDNGALQGVKHPVMRNATIQGDTTTHNPTLLQQNSHPIVMEPIDLTVSRKIALRDHAGWAAFMFNDVRKACANAEAIAITRVTAEAERDKHVAYALEMLRGTAHQVVNWLSDEARSKFLNERVEVAQAS